MAVGFPEAATGMMQAACGYAWFQRSMAMTCLHRG
jgi:hypothetical protein